MIALCSRGIRDALRREQARQEAVAWLGFYIIAGFRLPTRLSQCFPSTTAQSHALEQPRNEQPKLKSIGIEQAVVRHLPNQLTT